MRIVRRDLRLRAKTGLTGLTGAARRELGGRAGRRRRPEASALDARRGRAALGACARGSRYPVDALVEARWAGGADYYPAVVFAVGGNTVSLRYTDGDVEEGVPVNRVRPLPRRRSSAIPPQPAPRPAAKRPRADQPAPKPKKKPKTKKPPPKPPAPEPPAPKRRYDPEEPCAICLEPLGDAPQLPGCSHRLHAACVLGPDSLASHAWAENLPLLRRGQQVVCPVCRKTSWIPPGFL